MLSDMLEGRDRRFAAPRWWSRGNSKRRSLLRFYSAKVPGESPIEKAAQIDNKTRHLVG